MSEHQYEREELDQDDHCVAHGNLCSTSAPDRERAETYSSASKEGDKPKDKNAHRFFNLLQQLHEFANPQSPGKGQETHVRFFGSEIFSGSER